MAETKVCENCNTKNPISNNFCEQCGSKLNTAVPVEKSSKMQSTVKTVKESLPVTQSVSIGIKSTPININLSSVWLPILYGVLLLLTIYTRFDHLGSKPHHHDESMHAFYSYQLFKDGDYEYNPMMHGPFQFHGNALMYYLFGVSDATSRYLAATFGVLTVILAMLLGPFLGRIGTLLATVLIVFSPSFMYFDRFTREDAYMLGATFTMVVFTFRYYRFRQPIDLWLASLGFIVAFCTKESIFLTVAVIGTYLFIRLLPWIDVFVAGGITILGLLWAWQFDKTSPAYMPVFMLLLGAAFLYTMFQLFTRWQENLKKGKAENDLWEIVCGLGLEKISWEILAFVGWWIVTLLILGVFPHFGITVPIPFSSLMLIIYLGLVFWFCFLWIKNVVPAVTGSIAICSIVFTLLFTTFFTVEASQPDFWSRIHGLFNALYMGAFGGLEYWWEQHDVHRGDQPWYYYLIQLPANELVSFLFSMIAIGYYWLMPALARVCAFFISNIKNGDFYKKWSPWKLFPIFIVYWYLGTLALFSWAGEKMPWLILHPLLPALLLTAYFVGEIIESKPLDYFGQTSRIAAIAVFGLLLSYSLHSAILLSFYHEANPVEPLVYVQSGPDCKEVEKIVEQISYDETGGPNPTSPEGATDSERSYHDGLALTIEDKCSWPFAWIFRNFNRRNHPTTITAADNPIILTATESDAVAYPILSKAGYVNRKYKMRVWWVPSWFKKGYPSSDINLSLFVDWLFSNFIPLNPARPDMVDWNDIKNWILYRQVWSDLGSYNMRMWVRPDLAQKYGFTEDSRSDVPSDYPQLIQAQTSMTVSKHEKKQPNQ